MAIAREVREVVPSSRSRDRQLGQARFRGLLHPGPSAENERSRNRRQRAIGDHPEWKATLQLDRLRKRCVECCRTCARRCDGAIERRCGLYWLASLNRQRNFRFSIQVPTRRLANVLAFDLLIALKVGRDTSRVAEINVVCIEPVGYAAEAADGFERVEKPREPASS